jgi:integrase/recombinase XerC
MIDSFIQFIDFEKRYSKKTVAAYQTDLSQFADFLTATFDESRPEGASHQMIRSWVAQLTEQKIDPLSINRKIACLRSYFKFLIKNRIIEKNPTANIKVLKTKKKVPHFIRETEMVPLLDMPVYTDDLKGWRARVIIELFYSSGMRLSELIYLKDVDVNLNDCTIKVLGKRNKERIIPIPTGVIQLIAHYKLVRNQEVEQKEHGLLLVTDKGDKLYPMFVHRLVKLHLRAYTTVERASPHILRHTYATHLLNRGAEINAVKDLLGHSSLAATQVYTHNTIEKLKRVFEKAHPKA